MIFFVAVALFQNSLEKKKIFWQHSQFKACCQLSNKLLQLSKFLAHE